MNDDKKIMLEIYKMYAQTSENVSDRRDRRNSFFLTLCSAIIVATTAVFKSIDDNFYILILIGFIGVLISLVWYYNIQSYKQLNSGKFKVIHRLEKKLPFDAFKQEWDILRPSDKPKKYRLLTGIEKYISIIFIIVFLILMGVGILSYFSVCKF